MIEWGPQGGRFHLRTPRGVYRELQTPLLGLHQVQNAAVAVTLVETLRDRGFAVDEAQIREGLLSARWPGRLELVPGAPKILLDGVHNQGGAQAFARAFAASFPAIAPGLCRRAHGGEGSQGGPGPPRALRLPHGDDAPRLVPHSGCRSRYPGGVRQCVGLPATSCQNAGEALESRRSPRRGGRDGLCMRLALSGRGGAGPLAPRGIPLIAGSEVIAVTRNGNRPRRITRRGTTYGWSGT